MSPVLFVCATPSSLHPGAVPLRAPRAPVAARAPRNPLGLPQSTSSVHFALYWGDDIAVADGDAADLLEDFEDAWVGEVDGMDHPPPPSTATALFDVIVADSGDGAPSSYGATGYYAVDAEGYPYVVVAPETLTERDLGAHTAAHEFYHALQSVTARFDLDPARSGWVWESTAEWAAATVHPDNGANGAFVDAYLLEPERSVNAWAPGATLLGQRPYGAFLFPLDLSAAEVGVVPAAWADPGQEPDPIEVMRAWLADRGWDLDALWLDHLAHTTELDWYPQGALYADVLAEGEDRYRALDRFAAHLSGPGGSGTVAPEDAPARYGAALLALTRPDGGTARIEVDGASVGDLGTHPTWGARVVTVGTAGITVAPLPFEGEHGVLDVPIAATDALYVAVGVVAPAEPAGTDERFTFDWSVTITAEPPSSTPPTETSPAGCGCAEAAPSGRGARLGAALVGVALTARRNRRETAAPLRACPPAASSRSSSSPRGSR